MEARDHSRVAAVILAAGMASRMGGAKQLLRLGEHTVLEHVLENVRRSGVGDIVLVLGHAAETIRKSIDAKNLNIVVNDAYREGMGSSLRTGVSALPAEIDGAFIVLADQPFVQPSTLRLLMDRYRESNAQIVIPMYKGFRGNPVLLDRSVFPEVMALTGDIGCRAIFGDHPDGIVKAAVDDIGILLDIDNQEDLARSQRYAQREHDRDSMLEMIELRGRSVSSTEETPSDQNHLIVVGAEPVAIA